VTRDPLTLDLERLLAELDADEAQALRELFAVASGIDWEPPIENDYRPFVYPH
jgi:hypothetical protein